MNVTRYALVLLAAVPLAADPVADVRTAVGRLTGRDTMRATYELQQSVTSSGKLDNSSFNGKATVELEADANGVRVVVPRPLLDQLDREQSAHARNPNLKTPTVSAIDQIDLSDAATAVDFAPVLLRLLDGAKLVSDAQGTWAGKPVRVLVLRAVDRLDDDDKKRVKVGENKVTLWLGPDLVPLAVEHLSQAKFSFLVFKAESKRKESFHLAHVGDRLVRTRYEMTQTSSGMGQHGSEGLVGVVRVQ